MTDPIVYIPTSVDEKPEKDGEYFVLITDDSKRINWKSHAVFGNNRWQFHSEGILYKWLKPIPLSELWADKSFNAANVITDQAAEITALKAQLLQVAEEAWADGCTELLKDLERVFTTESYIRKLNNPYAEIILKKLGEMLPKYPHPDKSTYLSNLKEQLNIEK